MAYGSSFQQIIYYYSPFFIKNLISSIYGWVQSRKRYGRFYKKHFQSLSENQWFSKSELEGIQLQKTRSFLINANSHSKFYHNLFRQYDFQPKRMQSLSDLGVLPTLEKTTVRNQLRSIINDDLGKYSVQWKHTGGTTGAALIFPESLESFQREYAYRYIQYSWGGIRRGQRFAFCVGHPVTYHNRQTPPFWVYDYANNWLSLSSFHLNEKNIVHYILELERFQPDLLQGYPSSMYLLALANQHLGNKVRPRAIFTSSETLFDFQRDTIEKSFGCNVFSYYGNGERCGFIAQCEKGNHHLKLQHSYVEILDNSNQRTSVGNEGRLICTGFGNYATPLVRYDVGDVVILSGKESCECGRRGTIVKQIVGRTDDYILTPDGRFVGRLSPLFHNAIHVITAQIVQDDVKEVIIKIVKEPGYTKKEEQDILDKARVRFGSKIRISFEYVPDIPRTKNGKHRFIVSNIDKKKLFDQIVDYTICE